ncbi:hypothetical protein B0H19DRAFT_1256204 [Mycena capillaripes]|nr:hypothetical protein B0H19DRAFT_1256204 [Mycena capillaripes]
MYPAAVAHHYFRLAFTLERSSGIQGEVRRRPSLPASLRYPQRLRTRSADHPDSLMHERLYPFVSGMCLAALLFSTPQLFFQRRGTYRAT